MVQALSADRSDNSLRIRILPRVPGGNKNFLYAHFLYSIPIHRTVYSIPVTKQIPWYFISWESLNDLLCCPGFGRIFCHIEVDYSSPVVSQHHKDEQDLELHGWDHKKIDAHQVLHVWTERRK